MKRMFVILALALLAGCSTAQIKSNIEEKVAHDVAVRIEPVADPDLDNQIAVAKAHNDAAGAKCATATKQLIHELASATTPGAAQCLPVEFLDPATKTCKFGAATSIEALRVGAQNPAPFRLPDYWVEGCAVVYTDLRVSAIEFLGKLGLDFAGLKGAAAFGSAQTIKAIEAAHP